MSATDPASLSKKRAALQEIQAQADSVKSRAKFLEIETTIQTVQGEGGDEGHEVHAGFTRIIRDGVADEVRSALLEARRIMDQHLKLGRLSKSSRQWNTDFNQQAEEFVQKKTRLEQLEKLLETMRAAGAETQSDPVRLARWNEVLEKSRAVRREVLELTETLVKLHYQMDTQIRRDRSRENGLQDVFNRCMGHLPPEHRRKVSGILVQKTEGVDVEARIAFLSKFIGQLAQTVPAIRNEEIGRLLGLAKECLDLGHFKESIHTLDQVFQYDKKNLEGHRLRARVYLGMGNRFAHLCELRMITEIDTAEAGDYVVLADLLIADGQLDDAMLLYEKAVEKKKSRSNLEGLGDLAGRRGQWYRAVQVYQAILQMQPDLVPVQHKLGRALFESNREEEAFPILYRSMKADDGSSPTRVCLGRIYRKRQCLAEAVQCFRRALELDPENVEAHYWWGMLLYDQGQYAEGLSKARKAVELEPKRSRNHLLLARCHDFLGQSDLALSILEPFLQSSTPPVDVLLAFVECCRRSGQMKRSLPVLEDILKRHPRQPLLRAEYGLQLLQSGRFADAMAYLDPAAAFGKN